jgi:LAS superfamily LD-carboxypeptidase LdcB
VVFIGSIIAVVVAFIILVTVAVDAFSGDDGGGAAATAPTDTATATAGENTAPAASATTAPATSAPTTPPTVDPDDGSIVLTCGNILVPLDKQHKLPANCVPPNLQAVPAKYASGPQSMTGEALSAITEMFTAAQQAGFTMYTNSAYRSYSEQASTFQYWVNTSGLAYAERTSARAGHSEHQLGTTADVGARGLELEAFEGTPEAAWLAANAYKYGFIVSYPDGKESITGYAPEPWHVRYVGKDVAQKVRDSGLTLHEYLLR